MADRLWCDDRLLIDGRLVGASDGSTFENVNPATEGYEWGATVPYIGCEMGVAGFEEYLETKSIAEGV